MSASILYWSYMYSIRCASTHSWTVQIRVHQEEEKNRTIESHCDAMVTPKPQDPVLFSVELQ